jgi:tyrosine-protein phosphatase SIW14
MGYILETFLQGVPFMKTRLIKRLAIFVTLALLTPAGLSQQRADHEKLPNFHEVNSKLYRGAQPAAGGVQQLVRLGIRTIVNLRGKGEGVRKEDAEARAAGLLYFSIPFDRMGRPDDAEMKQVLSIIDTRENQPVFVHCKQGVDRTGTVIAIYRITHDGWTSEQAKAEANRYGMHPWERGMKNYIRDYYQQQLKEKKAVAQ